MKFSTRLLLKQAFKEYYFVHARRMAKEIREIHSREIAYVDFDADRMIRHINIKDEMAFATLITDKIPRHIYHSVAYYLFPDREMDKKDMIASDLVFDIDADKLVDRGAKLTKIKICDECKKSEISGETGDNERICPNCGGTSVRIVHWTENSVYNIAKKETLKLINILINDFDLKEDKIVVYFSGGRGFHVHVVDETVRELDPQARLELIDYIKLTGYDLSLDNHPERRTRKLLNLILRGGLPEAMKWFSEDDLKELKRLVQGGSNKASSDLIKRMGKGLKKKLEDVIRFYEGVEIDAVVTADVHRLIRFPESIHGGTGLIKRRVSDLDGFEPLDDAIPNVPGHAKVHVYYSPRFSMTGKEYGPFEDEIVELPLPVAMHLMCKGLADVEG